MIEDFQEISKLLVRARNNINYEAGLEFIPDTIDILGKLALIQYEVNECIKLLEKREKNG